jgi:hypothetical protein
MNNVDFSNTSVRYPEKIIELIESIIDLELHGA